MPESLVLLHGFGGTHRAWDRVVAQLSPQRYTALALDLPGHGEAAQADPPVTFDSCIAHVLGRAPQRFALCGYSLGGRVALNVALAAPQRVTRLVLVSSSAGIVDDAERAARREADHRLADQLEQIPFEQFIERWRTQPLFAEDPPHVGELAREDQRRNDPRCLAAVMRGIGTGEMTPLWDRLGELPMPTLAVAGERDEKFTALAVRMAALVPNATFAVIPGGHSLALESPLAIAELLEG